MSAGMIGLCAAACGLLVPPSQAVVVSIAEPFEVSFYNNGETDGSGSVSLQDWTAQQMDDVLASLQAWSGQIANTAGRRVEMHAFWTNFSGAVIGQSFNPKTGDGTTAWSFTELVWREGVDYSRPAGYYSDSRLTYDIDAAGFAWNFGADAAGAGELDFRSIVTHEVGHTLGFGGTYQSAGDQWWAGGITEFDALLRDDAGNRPLAGSAGTPGNFNELDNPAWFVGAHAVASNGGASVAIYAPEIYSSASSLAHMDEGAYPTSLMSPSIAIGETTRPVSDTEWGVMKDLGWQVIPEPVTTVLLAVGMAALYVRRRRRLAIAPPGAV